MAARKRRAERYRSGDCTLGWRGGYAVADFRDPGSDKRQRVKLGRFRKDSKQARDALDAFVESRRALLVHTNAYNVGQLWDLWMADRKRDGFDNRIYQYQWVSLKPAFGHRRPDMLSADDFRDYARARFDLGRSPWTVHNELVRLRTCLKWAADTHLIDKRPKVWVPTAGGHRERVLTLEEARALVAAAKQGDPHIHVFTVVAFATAARHTAILDLEWPRVDFMTGLIEFDLDAERDPMSRAWQKGRATVPMNRAVRNVLELAYAGRQCSHVVEHGGDRLKTVKNGFFNAVRRASEVAPTLGKWVAKNGKRVFETDVTPHVIRHTVLTWLDQAVPDARRAQLAGHANEDITKRVYTHAAPEVLQEAVERLNDALHDNGLGGAPVEALTHLGDTAPTDKRKRAKKLPKLSRMDKSANRQA
jgi:integrase